MKKNKKNKQQINYLDLIPVRPEKLGWHIDRRERVVLEVKNEAFSIGSHRHISADHRRRKFIWMCREVICGR